MRSISATCSERSGPCALAPKFSLACASVRMPGTGTSRSLFYTNQFLSRFIDDVTEFGLQENRAATAPQSPCDRPFAVSCSIGVGRVDDVCAEIDCAVKGANRHRIAGFSVSERRPLGQKLFFTTEKWPAQAHVIMPSGVSSNPRSPRYLFLFPFMVYTPYGHVRDFSKQPTDNRSCSL